MFLLHTLGAAAKAAFLAMEDTAERKAMVEIYLQQASNSGVCYENVELRREASWSKHTMRAGMSGLDWNGASQPSVGAARTKWKYPVTRPPAWLGYGYVRIYRVPTYAPLGDFVARQSDTYRTVRRPSRLIKSKNRVTPFQRFHNSTWKTGIKCTETLPSNSSMQRSQLKWVPYCNRMYLYLATNVNSS